MFILTPFLLFSGAVLMALIITVRRFPALGRLAQDTPVADRHTRRRVFTEDLLPEVFDVFRKVQSAGHKEKVLVETEKFLRKIRLSILAIERVFDGLIHKVRRVQRNQAVQDVQSPSVAPPVHEPPKTVSAPEVQTQTSAVLASFPREPVVINSEPQIQVAALPEEDGLIAAIAQNPKDPALYESLGDIYVQAGSFEDARESYKAGLKLSPGSESLLGKFSLVLEKIPQKRYNKKKSSPA